MTALALKRNPVSLSFNFEDISQTDNWQNKLFSNPSAHIRLATVFSGIGAIEQAFKRLHLNHSIVFAGDIDPHVKKVTLPTMIWQKNIGTPTLRNLMPCLIVAK